MNNVEYPNEQQLFVGNLKSFVTEDDLKDHFENYGTVIKVNIVVARQGSNKPNYGFVIFENAKAVDCVFDNLVSLFCTFILFCVKSYKLSLIFFLWFYLSLSKINCVILKISNRIINFNKLEFG